MPSSKIEVGTTKFAVADPAGCAHNLGMSGYGQFCPIARASEVFAERWTPLIVREIMSDHHHFSEILKGLHSISPSMLGQRLRSLEQKGVIETRPNPTGRGSTYYLTDAGSQLAEIVRGLGIWGQQWLEVQRQHLDADVAMWAILTHLHPDKLPSRRRVVRFEFRDDKRRYWLVLRRDDPDLCYSDPGFGDDLVIRTDLECITRVYLGELRLADARRSGRLDVVGSRELARGLDEWFPVSSFGAHARPVKFDRSSGSFVRINPSRVAAAQRA
jgi:DNA-binding HxlR family transcriptional regulator